MSTTFLGIANRSYSTLASDITDDQTYFSVATGEGSRFPSGNPAFIAVIGNPGASGLYPGGCEHVLVSARSSDDFSSVTRSYDGTTAPYGGWLAGTPVRVLFVATYLTEMQTAINARQDSHANLTSLAGLTFASLAFVKMNAANTFSLDTTSYQAADATLTALAGTGVANTFPYFTGTDVAASASITAAGLAILDDANAAAQCTTLGLGTGSTPRFTGLGLGTSWTYGLNAPLHVERPGVFTTTSTEEDQDNIFLEDFGGTQAQGAFGASIGFSLVNPAFNVIRRAAIASVQTGADPDVVGLAFFTHPSATSSVALVEAARFCGSGCLSVGATTDLGAGCIFANDFGAFLGGVHVGGTSDPGTDNLIVDGISEFTGFVKTTGGVHVGGTSDPGTGNLLVDGTLTTVGLLTVTGGITSIAGNIDMGGSVTAGGLFASGVAGMSRGSVWLFNGPYGNTCGYVALHSRSGALYYLWVSDSGVLRISSIEPVNNTDGTVVGTQS